MSNLLDDQVDFSVQSNCVPIRLDVFEDNKVSSNLDRAFPGEHRILNEGTNFLRLKNSKVLIVIAMPCSLIFRTRVLVFLMEFVWTF